MSNGGASCRGRSPIDSAGKRAAFALFYAPLHFLTVQRVVTAIGANGVTAPRTIVDLGCGTGVAGAAWAGTFAAMPTLRGVDLLGWAVDEAMWNWRTLGVSGVARRGDLIEAAERLGSRPRRETSESVGVMLGWSVNELDPPGQKRLLPLLMEIGRRGGRILIIEPIARRMTPWFDAWTGEFTRAGGRVDDWHFPADLPPHLAELDRAAGFNRTELSAKTLALGL